MRTKTSGPACRLETDEEPKTYAERFKELYLGKTLGVAGGEPCAHQVRKLTGLGVRVVWLETKARSRGGRPLTAATENAILLRRMDLLLVFTRRLSHNAYELIMRAVRRPGAKVLPAVASPTLNTEVVARLFLAHKRP